MAEQTAEQTAALRNSVQEMFGNISEYVRGELEGTAVV